MLKTFRELGFKWTVDKHFNIVCVHSYYFGQNEMDTLENFIFMSPFLNVLAYCNKIKRLPVLGKLL